MTSLRGKSILLIGRPGVGKTTVLRDIARELSEVRTEIDFASGGKTRTIIDKTVVVVDKTNEIAGDSDTPHE